MRFKPAVFMLLLCGCAAAQVVVTPQNFATLPGPGIVPAVPSAPLVVAPVVQIEWWSPNPVGATNATGGNQAGATNATLQSPVSGYPAVFQTPVVTRGGNWLLPAQAMEMGAGVEPESPQRAEFNAGVARMATAYAAVASRAGSLGEMAARYKQQPARHAARMWTSDDVKQLEQRVPLSIVPAKAAENPPAPAPKR